MFKLPALPSARAGLHELADFAELLAWANGSVSAREIVAFLGREGESEPNRGCEDSDDENADALDEVMNEIERRQAACRVGYPYALDAHGNVLHYAPSDDGPQAALYGYLLLSTRLNMTTTRTHAGIDGTLLLEEVSAAALRQYLGSNRAQSFVFGTAAGSADFPEKVNALCQALGEGGGFHAYDSGPVQANDDKLDVVAWSPFADKSPSQIIVFGQCKTGTAWSQQLCQLQPDAFSKKWIDRPFLFDPLRAFCISEAADRSRWGGYAAEGGLLLDRCRLVDCCDDLDADLSTRMARWCNAALEVARVSL
ncbi:MAG: hypothetical protein PHU46_09745 [Rhodocyclaceae bacterium]|nr:hypothetical protein [Rhodocyclaceae bacterium]